MRSVASLLICNSAESITVELYSDHQRRVEECAGAIVKEREKRVTTPKAEKAAPKNAARAHKL